MKPRTHAVEAFAVLLAVAALTITLTIGSGGVVGCQQIEEAARDVEYVTAQEPTAPTTAPAGDDDPAPREVIRGGVQGVARANSTAADVIAAVSAIAGLVAYLAGRFNGKRVERKRLVPAIAEVVDDVHIWREPGKPWTDTTRVVLEQLGQYEAAHVDEYPS